MIKKKKREEVFYQLFIEFIDKIVLVGEEFDALVKDLDHLEDKVAHMKVLETECDMEAHKILQELHGSFITPFDREDIYEITKEMDEIVDCMEEASNRFILFNIDKMHPTAIELSGILLQAIRELAILFKHLKEMKKSTIVMDQIIEVNRVENEGDAAFRKGMARLFREEKDPIELIKWKHLLEEMEESIDSCEKVANLIEGVVMKYA